MKKHAFLLIFLMVFAFVMVAKAQNKTDEKPKWSHYFEADFYFEDDFYVLPIYRADRNHLHLEARYIYYADGRFCIWKYQWIGYRYRNDIYTGWFRVVQRIGIPV